MKIAVQYVTDSRGEPTAVIVPLSELKKVLTRLRKYERELNMKLDLTEALAQVAQIPKLNARVQKLHKFLHEL